MLETYAECPPETTPVMDGPAGGTWWYPYASRTNLLTQRTPVSWRGLNLENEYLACSFLPDLRGRLYSCTDKLNNRSMFYTNPSIKKALIAIRGAWVATGIEPNFPVAHSRDTVSPVNFGIEQGKDHGAVWLENRDRRTAMRWRVEFVLRDGSAVLDERVELSNPTAVRAPYFWWNDAEVPLEPGRRFIVPTHLMATHGMTEMETWPVSQSHVDLSAAAKITQQLAWFAHGSREGFMAVYDAGTRTATVHFADAAVVSGKKLWAWGAKEDLYFRRLLNDDNGGFVEMQAGLFENQETYEFLGPHERRSFTEYWMAARELGGISQATPDAILNLERKQVAGVPALAAEVNVTRAIRAARVRIFNGETAVVDEAADLKPRTMLLRSVPNPAAGAYRFELADKSGHVLLAHTEGVYDAIKPSELKLGKQEQRDWRQVSSQADYLARGNFNERNSHFMIARGDYGAGAEKFPASARLKKAAGRLAVMRNRFPESERLLTEAAAGPGGTPDDVELRYYGGRRAWGKKRRREKIRRGWGEITSSGRRRWWKRRSRRRAADSHRRPWRLSGRRSGRAENRCVQTGQRWRCCRTWGKTEEARARAVAWRVLDPVDPFLQVEETGSAVDAGDGRGDGGAAAGIGAGAIEGDFAVFRGCCSTHWASTIKLWRRFRKARRRRIPTSRGI